MVCRLCFLESGLRGRGVFRRWSDPPASMYMKPSLPLTEARSVPVPCIKGDDSRPVLDRLAAAVRARRVAEAAE